MFCSIDKMLSVEAKKALESRMWVNGGYENNWICFIIAFRTDDCAFITNERII